MRTRIVTIAMQTVFVAVAWAFASPAAAQTLETPRARQGYYVGIGVQSSGGAARDADVGGLGAAVGGQGYLRFGQVVNTYLGLGLVLDGGLSRSADWTDAGGSFRVEASLTPWPDVPVSLRGGLGLGVRALSRADSTMETDDDPSGAFGAAYSLGVAYDWFPWRRAGDSGGWSVTFSAQAQVLPAGDVTRGVALFGVGLSYWSGLSRSKLDLPLGSAFAR